MAGVTRTERLRHVVGGSTATALGDKLGLETVGQLLNYLPRRYAKGGELTDIASLETGDRVFLQVTVKSASGRQIRPKLHKTDLVVEDGSGGRLPVTLFNKRYLEKKYPPGSRILLDGTVGEFRSKKQLTEPLITESMDDLLTGGLIPIYPLVKGISNVAIARSVRLVLDQLEELPDPLPVELRRRERLPELAAAYELIHRPKDYAEAERGKGRLRWDEAILLQVALAQRRAASDAVAGTPRPERPGGLREAFVQRLPFTLTAGQAAVVRQLADDLAQPHPMHRLLEGEVGSGKTVVALLAMLAVIDAGGQAALLAPTEVLAAQHARSLRELLGPLGRAGELAGLFDGDGGGAVDCAEAGPSTRIVLLTGSTGASARREALAAAADGSAGIVVGTHALLEPTVQYRDLGLVVIDEQHRFGVEQRNELRSRGERPPHLLVMTATPIPRTVAMTVFGDLETSSLTELPKGRQPIASFVVPAEKPAWVARMWALIGQQVAEGRQAYVVCPRIGDDEKEPDPGGDTSAGEGGEARRPAISVLEAAEKVAEELPGLRVAILHGRLPAEQKDATMTAFARGEIDVLVSTTVIEVGVDVPNASVMLILDADRFGISQLHQLRGRVGRGAAASHCLLFTQAYPGSSSYERVSAVAATQDGRELARLDLAARREGDVLGSAQSGTRGGLRLLSLLRDEELIRQARADATALVSQDPGLTDHPVLAEALADLVDPDRAAFLEKG